MFLICTLIETTGTRVYVHVGSEWRNKLEGLCGNYDGDMGNDFSGFSNPTDFGNSWKLSSGCADVQQLSPTEQEPCHVRRLNCSLLRKLFYMSNI